jgi:hypothetical protein
MVVGADAHAAWTGMGRSAQDRGVDRADLANAASRGSTIANWPHDPNLGDSTQSAFSGIA